MKRGFQMTANKLQMTAKKAAHLSSVICLLLSACEVGPDYDRPDAPITTYFKEQPGWVLAKPQLVGDQGPWWAIYNDPLLDGLEKQIVINNQNLKASEAAYRQSQSIVEQARTQFYPTVTGNFSQQFSQSGRQHNGGGGGSVVSGASTTTTSTSGGAVEGGTASQGATILNTGTTGGVTRTYDVTSGFSWDLDVWGRIRRLVEADVANAQASAADLEAATLAAQGALAEDYFTLRGQDQLQILLQQTLKDYQQSLQITINQYHAGTAAKSDVIQAQTQVDSAQSQLINITVERQQMEHAIAVLTGQPPSSLTIPPAPLTGTVPQIPVDVPSTLLERRPDIAEAERNLQAANAEIGIAIAAFYPDVTLSADYGYAGPVLTSLIQAANRVWSAGPQVTETLFDAGERSAEVEQARATYEQSLANYRQTVLSALQAVEDDLVEQRVYAQQQVVQDRAVAESELAVKLFLNQYRAGIIVFSNVIQEQEIALSAEETDVTLRQNRLTASVALIEALGGGWNQDQLPNHDQVEDPTYGGDKLDACDLAGVLMNTDCW